jgi:hypothetical protein
MTRRKFGIVREVLAAFRQPAARRFITGSRRSVTGYRAARGMITSEVVVWIELSRDQPG